jgi:glycosyltransferase involved in cell wall biosynthesis
LKIVYVTSESYIDHSFTIASELRKHTDLAVFLQGKEKSPEIENWCSKLSAIFIKRMRFRNPLSFFGELRFILRVKKLNADAVWFNTLTVYQLCFVKILIGRFLVTVHDVEIHPGGGGHGNIALKMTLKFARRNVCVVSKTQAELFKSYYGFEPKVFQLPIIDYYREISDNSGEKEPSGKIRFFFFGSIEPYKGIEILLDAAEILEAEAIDFSLNIYGKIKYGGENLIKRLKSLKKVTLYGGFVNYNEVHKIYSQNDVLVLPYRQVTQCGPLLIGFDELVPVVCSDLDGFREYIEDGASGIIFSGTAQDLAGKMRLFIDNPGLMSEIRDNIKKSAYKKFLISNLRKSYLENLQTSSV